MLVVRRIVLPEPGALPLRTLAFAGVIYGVATVAHGSGFFAVYIAGILIGDADIPPSAASSASIRRWPAWPRSSFSSRSA